MNLVNPMTKRCKLDEKCDPLTDPASSYSFGPARRRAGAALNALNLLLRKRDYPRVPATMGIFDKFNTAFGNSKVWFLRAFHRHSATVRVLCAYSVVLMCIVNVPHFVSQVGQYFDINARKSTFTQELRAGTVTFLTVSAAS